MCSPSRSFFPLSRGSGSAPIIRLLLLSVGLAIASFTTTSPLSAQSSTPSSPDAAGRGSTETVLAVVRTCPREDINLRQCEDVAGVTLGVEVDGAALPDGPVTTEPGGIGLNAAPFQAPSDALLAVIVLDGVPDGYIFAAGTFRSIVSNLPSGGCGGEATCRYLTIVLTPEPLAPVPDPDQAPIIDSEVSFAFGADDWTGAFEEIDAKVYQRQAVAIYGAASPYPSATLSFELDAGGNGKTALTLTGIDDELPGPNPITITVNGEIVHDEELGFYDWNPEVDEVAWNRSTLYFDSNLLRPGENTITIENRSDAAAVGEPPYLLLLEAFVNVDVGGLG